MANFSPTTSLATTEFETVFSSNYGNKSTHKSLDFSDINIAAGDMSNTGLRRFHQTSIYVQGFTGMLSHTNKATGASYLITANLPEQIQYKIGSKWEAPLNFGDSKLNLAAQFVANKFDWSKGVNSGVNRAMTMQIWGGSDPLEMQLKIPVIDDGVTNSHTNLVEALEFLGCLCLPSQEGKMGFLTPPPSPVELNIKYGKEDSSVANLHSTKGRVTIQLGGILLLDNILITGVNVSYPNTKTQTLHSYRRVGQTIGKSGYEYLSPLLAEITLTVKTVEAVTKENYSRMLWLKSNEGMGTGNMDVSPVVEGVKQVASTIWPF